MGSVCPSCYFDRYKIYWTRDPDDSPRLCATHIQKEHPDDICNKCKKSWSKHTLKKSGIDGHTLVFECEI